MRLPTYKKELIIKKAHGESEDFICENCREKIIGNISKK